MLLCDFFVSLWTLISFVRKDERIGVAFNHIWKSLHVSNGVLYRRRFTVLVSTFYIHIRFSSSHLNLFFELLLKHFYVFFFSSYLYLVLLCFWEKRTVTNKNINKFFMHTNGHKHAQTSMVGKKSLAEILTSANREETSEEEEEIL